MAANGTGNLNLLDLSLRMEKGTIAPKIVELLTQQNEVLDDMSWVECNDGTGHKTTVRTGLPAATWRLLNYGVAQTKSTTAQIKDGCGMLENYSTVDASLVNMAGDKAAFRLSEDKPFIEGMNQTQASTLFYGNTNVNPERYLGLSNRFNALTGVENADNVISAAGAGSDNTSVWIIVWGENTVHGIYPKGSNAGLSHRDLGEQTVYDVNNNPYQAFRSHYKWDCGLSVRDWRYIVRICNIDRSDLTKNAATGADLVDLIMQGLETVKDLTSGRPAIYGNRSVGSFLRRQMVNKANLCLNMEEVFGKRVMTIDGVPFRRTDALLNTEAAVS